jgi:hypothetical protein
MGRGFGTIGAGSGLDGCKGEVTAVEDGRYTPPRPPRRIPAGAGTITQLQVSTPRSPAPPPKQPWIYGRFLAGFLVVVLIVAAGASAGWWIRSRSLRIDLDQVQSDVGGAVVRVLASTCGSTGLASGVLLAGGQILTAASAVAQPLSIVVVTPDGRIRQANLISTTPDGIAVLRLIGTLAGTPASIASAKPDPHAGRALIGYTDTGKQVVNDDGSDAKPRALSELMNAGKLGSPIVSRTGQVVGLVTGATVQAATVTPLERLPGYAGPNPVTVTTAPGGTCTDSRGPQLPIAPELQVARTPLAVEVQQLFANYLTLENRRDFVGVRKFYSVQHAKSLPLPLDATGHRTTYFFGPKLSEVSSDSQGGTYARVTFNALFSPVATGAGGRVCQRLDYRYRLVRQRGALVIDSSVSMAQPPNCEAD